MSAAGTPESDAQRSRRIEPLPNFLGIGFLRFELVLLGVVFAQLALFFALGKPLGIASTFISTCIVGNFTGISLHLAYPVYSRIRNGLTWVVFLAILVPVSAAASLLSSLALMAVLPPHGIDRMVWLWSNLGTGTVIAALTGVAIYAVTRTREELEEQNLLLKKQVETGALRLSAQEADLAAAYEIQRHLLPATLPEIPGMRLAIAWQPAQSVGGDYFDALTLDADRTVLCVADVSGKGISAALLMANLQAGFRAFAPQATGPGALCTALNQVLCGNIAPGKFVTLFCAVLEARGCLLQYENAGHCQPILLRKDEATSLPDGGTVLGLFPEAAYEERTLRMRSGDCLLLMTDGVTEAANADGEEFGEARVIEAARSVRAAGGHAVRNAILEAVTRFCEDKFQDDATLMVLTVD